MDKYKYGIIVFLVMLMLAGCNKTAHNADNTNFTDSMVSAITSYKEENTTETSVEALIQTPLTINVNSSEQQDDIDFLDLMDQLTDIADYDEKVAFYKEHHIKSFHGRYIIFDDSFKYKEISKTSTPLKIADIYSQAYIVEFFEDKSKSNPAYNTLLYNMQINQSNGIIMIIPFEGYYLIGVANSTDSKFNQFAIFKDLPEESVHEILLKDSNNDKLEEGLYFTPPLKINYNGLNAYKTDLIKKNGSRGDIVLQSFFVDRISLKVFSEKVSDIYDIKRDYNKYSDPVESLRSFVLNSNSILMDNHLIFHIENKNIIIVDKSSEESTVVPLPERHINNLEKFTAVYDINKLFTICLVQDEGYNKIYSLKALFGWEEDYWQEMPSKKVFLDVASIFLNFDENTGNILNVKVVPKYSHEQASQKKYLTEADMNMGPFKVCITSTELLEEIKKEAYDKNQLKVIEDNIQKMQFFKFEYNGIIADYHPLADIIPSFSTNSIDCNYRTSKGIGINSSKEEVVKAYGLPDIGLSETNQWFYFTKYPYWMSPEDQLTKKDIIYKDGMTIIFNDMGVESIKCEVFISTS